MDNNEIIAAFRIHMNDCYTGDPTQHPGYAKFAAGYVAAKQAPQEARPFDCWSNNDGDGWLEHPADGEFVDGLKVGDTYELLAGWNSVRATYRVITAPDDESDNYEVECVSHPVENAPAAAVPVSGAVDEREAFEAWARLSSIDTKFPDLSREGAGYWQPRTDTAWKTWQARAALQPAQTAPTGDKWGYVNPCVRALLASQPTAAVSDEQIEQAHLALGNLDDYARMDCGVDATGPRGVLEKFIASVAQDRFFAGMRKESAQRERDQAVSPDYAAWLDEQAMQGIEAHGGNEIWNAATKAALLSHPAAPAQPTPAVSGWVPLTDEDRQQIFDSMPGGLDGFLNTWGWLPFSKALEAKCREKNSATLSAPAAQQPSNYHDAYRGARDDLQEWKNRALKAEESCRKLAAVLNAENGPTHMGEPVLAQQPSDTSVHKPTIDAVAKALHALEVHDAGHPGTAFKVHGMCIEAVCALLRPAAQEAEKPHPVALTCPACGKPHIDEGEWATRPHKTHQCQYCKTEWRPFHHATVGVAQEAAREQPAPCDMGELCIGCTPRREDGGCPGEQPAKGEK